MVSRMFGYMQFRRGNVSPVIAPLVVDYPTAGIHVFGMDRLPEGVDVHGLVRIVAVAGLLAAISAVIAPSTGGAQAARRIEVCKLLPAAEVKKHLPWQDFLDKMPPEEEAVGASGSSCNYATVHVQVLPYTPSFIEALRKSGPIEAVSGLGDEAYFRNNKNMFAEVVVRVGSRLLTLQGDADDNVATVRPKVIALARLYVEKLR